MCTVQTCPWVNPPLVAIRIIIHGSADDDGETTSFEFFFVVVVPFDFHLTGSAGKKHAQHSIPSANIGFMLL